MKKRLLPEDRTRTPNPVSLLSRVSYADLRGRSALTRAAVRVILAIRLLPVAVAAGERRVAESVPLQQLSGEKTTLFQMVSTAGALGGVAPTAKRVDHRVLEMGAPPPGDEAVRRAVPALLLEVRGCGLGQPCLHVDDGTVEVEEQDLRSALEDRRPFPGSVGISRQSGRPPAPGRRARSQGT